MDAGEGGGCLGGAVVGVGIAREGLDDCLRPRAYVSLEIGRALPERDSEGADQGDEQNRARIRRQERLRDGDHRQRGREHHCELERHEERSPRRRVEVEPAGGAR